MIFSWEVIVGFILICFCGHSQKSVLPGSGNFNKGFKAHPTDLNQSREIHYEGLCECFSLQQTSKKGTTCESRLRSSVNLLKNNYSF
jgi:hypothetical protein